MPFPLNAKMMIREKMDLGVLPSDQPSKMSARRGTDEPCAGCETPILRAEVEYAFETPDGRAIRFHVGCAGLWEAERRRRGWK